LQVAIYKIITDPERQRKEFHHIEELAESLKKFGFLQPIVVHERPDKNFDLIAGERRLRAATLANMKSVPVVRKTDLNEIQLLELELEENFQREDLTWVEKTLAVAKIHKGY